MDARRWAEIRSVFDELVHLEPATRRARLESLGGSDPDLRAELESLLAADAEASMRLGQVETPFLGAVTDPLGLAGRTLSHFRIHEPLGAGGMGVVYRAEDPRLGRPVALKLLLPQYGLDPAARQRFLQEARSAGSLDHSNLCTIYDVGESEGRLFLAMPLYAGETLKARLAREGALPVDEAVDIARQIAAGLACAHGAGIVHRDLKPANVMLLPGGAVKILDFGLAKARDVTLTRSSATLGTVAYMAPEQLRGEAVDARMDLWALGVVLHEMLTGRRPFSGDGEPACAHAIVHEEPAPPSALRPEVPPAVDGIVLALLRKRPADRHTTAAEVAARLSDRRTIEAPLRSRGARPGRRVGPVGVGSLAAVVGVAWVLVVALGDRAPTLPAESRIALLPLAYHGRAGNGYLAEGLVDMLSHTLNGAGDLYTVDPALVRRYASTLHPDAPGPDEGARIAERFGADRYVIGNVVEAGDQLVLTLSLFRAAGARAEPVVRITRSAEAGALVRLVDETGLALLGHLLPGDTSVPRRYSSIAVVATRSPDALKAYFQGERLFQAGRLDEAAERLGEAVTLDTAFALAYYRLGDATGWGAGSTIQADPIERAVHFADRLPKRERVVVEAWNDAYRLHRADRALSTLIALVQSEPDYLDARIALGMLRFQHGLRAGGTAGAVRTEARRALDLDPTSLRALTLLGWVAMIEDDQVALDSIGGAILARAPEHEWNGLWQGMRVFPDGDESERQAFLERARGEGWWRWGSVTGALWLDTDLDRASRSADLLAADAPTRYRAQAALAGLSLSRGRWDGAGAAYSAMKAARQTSPVPFFCVLAGGLPVELPSSLLSRLQAELSGMPPPTTLGDSIVASYARALLAARRGRWREAQEGADELERFALESREFAGDSASAGVARRNRAMARDHALALRAFRAWRGGDPQAALGLLERARPQEWWGMLALGDPVRNWSFPRFLRAEILFQLGRLDEALPWYDGLGTELTTFGQYRPIRHLRLGQIRERAGDRVQARWHYERVVALLNEADPPWLGIREEAERGIAREP